MCTWYITAMIHINFYAWDAGYQYITRYLICPKYRSCQKNIALKAEIGGRAHCFMIIVDVTRNCFDLYDYVPRGKSIRFLS